jgi:hypothetical protein
MTVARSPPPIDLTPRLLRRKISAISLTSVRKNLELARSTPAKSAPPMNRIYQGRVSGVLLLDEKTGKPLDPQPSDWDGETALWQHHTLFQDAVNYYVVCLLALAGKDSPLWPIREKLDAHDEHGNPDERMVWRPFRRRGALRSGLRDSVAPHLCPGKADATPEDCFAAVLAGNDFALHRTTNQN